MPSNNPKGRPKGSPNKVTTGLREAILEAADYRGRMLNGQATIKEAEDLSGTARFLLETTDTKDRTSFMTLLGKVLPLTVEGGDPDKPIRGEFTVGIVKLADQSN